MWPVLEWKSKPVEKKGSYSKWTDFVDVEKIIKFKQKQQQQEKNARRPIKYSRITGQSSFRI